MIFPKPQKVESAQTIALKTTPSLTLHIADISLKAERSRLFGTVFAENGNVTIHAEQDTTERLCYIEKCSRLTDEKYILDIMGDETGIEVALTYSGRRSLWYALNTVEKMAAANFFPIGRVEDYPLFEKRGFIEGFYGKTWQPGQRLQMLRLAAQNGINTFYYAPKDDPYHRRLWRELYPEQELRDLKTLVDTAADLCIDFHYCIAPGLSMRYTSEADFSDLMNKTKQLYDIGVRGFGLLLDDIPHELAFEEDKARYGETVNAHIDLINRYHAALCEIDKRNRLTVCPMQYHGKGTEYQISKFGRGIVPEAEVFWTGNEICSREITVPEAVRFIDATNHRPLYWDNYPVNDAEMHNEMHLGPIMGRDEDLYRYSKGIIANCMEYFECTKVPLLTIADYLWNPLQYDKDASYQNALNLMIGKENVELFLLFADHLKTSCLHDSNSRLMSDVLGTAGAMILKGEGEAAFTQLGEYLEKMKECVNLLGTAEAPIFKELRRWSDKFALCTTLLELGMEYLLEGEDEVHEKILRLSSQYNNDATVLTGFCFREFLEFVTDR
ncbi:MAG: beta-N-acetylglucosaminidase domain-containing protein [Oscillospiraceae bacterium]|jgi:hyaluronoglucosaminidase|nr:beta-N-acetylglucosaminidase domain-containing protein [Oscillospiraceae bacterium]